MTANRGGWTVADGNDVRQVSSVADLETTLDGIHELARQRHRLVTIVSPEGSRLLIGLGGAKSVLQFSSGDEPPYFATLGDPKEEGVEAFFLEGEATEVARRRLIPMEGARHAAIVFFETGMRPNTVAWDEV